MKSKFIATTELGRLSKWLRILGYDAIYTTSHRKGDLFLQSLRENRIILTRNLKLSKPTSSKVLFIKSTDYKKQLKEIIEKLNLKIDRQNMFTRCVVCNEKLADIPREKVANKIPQYVFNAQQNFTQCKKCDKIYWHGTHWGNVSSLLKGMGIREKWNL